MEQDAIQNISIRWVLVGGRVKVAYAVAIGSILRASVLLGRIAIGDCFTSVAISTSLFVLFL